MKQEMGLARKEELARKLQRRPVSDQNKKEGSRTCPGAILAVLLDDSTAQKRSEKDVSDEAAEKGQQDEESNNNQSDREVLSDLGADETAQEGIKIATHC